MIDRKIFHGIRERQASRICKRDRRFVLCMTIVTSVLLQTFFPRDAVSGDWVNTIQASAPSYWWRFEIASTNNGVENAGTVPGFDGTFGRDIAHEDLGHPSATPELGLAMEFTGPSLTRRSQEWHGRTPRLEIRLGPLQKPSRREICLDCIVKLFLWHSGVGITTESFLKRMRKC
jgi:hypothetical protein